MRTPPLKIRNATKCLRWMTSSVTTTQPSKSSLPPSTSFLDRLSNNWNERSGTLEILQLKEQVSASSQQFDEATAEVTHARRHLDDCFRLSERTSGQHMQLLQRRETWNTEDALLFGDLVSKEVETRKSLENARSRLQESEQTCSQRQLEYMNAMRKRYHEEQIWQDQWRVLSTFGTWSLIVLNTCVFLASQYFYRIREMQKMKTMELLIREKFENSNNNNTPISSSSKEEKEEIKQVVAVQEEATNNKDSEASSKEKDSTQTEIRQKEGETATTTRQQWLLKKSVPSWLQQWLHHQTESLDQRLRRSSERILSLSSDNIHAPSALLGASVTGMAFLVAMMLTNNKR